MYAERGLISAVYLNRSITWTDPLLKQIHRTGDHVFGRRYGRYIGLITLRGAHEVSHLLGRIDFGEGDVAIGIGVGMPWEVAAFGIAVVHDDARLLARKRLPVEQPEKSGN